MSSDADWIAAAIYIPQGRSLGQIYYAFSATVSARPPSLSQDVGLGLGAQAGQRRLSGILKEAGFTSVRRASETPAKMVLEVTG